MTPILLIVDDDPDDMAFTTRVIGKKHKEVRCVEAFNGEAALEFLANSEILPAVVLMDLKMPGMSGIDVLRRIRADKRLSHLPVVIMTNSMLDSDRSKALSAGADDFMQKAFDLRRYAEEIAARLERWLAPMETSGHPTPLT
jgi:two-component system response regulator